MSEAKEDGIEKNINKTTPVVDFFRYGKECKKLNDRILDGDTKNIAISGIFGAGKSSMIYTYEKAFNNRKGRKIIKKYFGKNVEDIDFDEKKKDSNNSKNKLNEEKLNTDLMAANGNSKRKFIKISLANFNLRNDKRWLSSEKEKLNANTKDLHNDSNVKGNDEDERSKEKLLKIKAQNDQIKEVIENLDLDGDINNKQEGDVNNDVIEKNLLQQFIFNVPSKKLPDSKIKRVDKRFGLKITSLVMFIVTLLCASVFLLNKYSLIWEMNIAVDKVFLSVGILSVITLLTFLPMIFRLKSLKVDTFEISASDKETDRDDILSRYLDEIIYFFEKTGTKIVYFEDLDRLPDLTIFNKLRELNYLLNNTTYIKHKIVFVYCVSDSILADSEERNKFFDSIISVNPFLTQESVENAIKQEFVEEKQTTEISDFYTKLSKYITDSRMLQNIKNDFQELMFKNKEHEMQVRDKMKLFTLATYKNLYYDDYNKLNTKDDCISKAFVLIDNCRKLEIEKIDKEIIKNKELLDSSADNEVARLHNFKEKIIAKIIANATAGYGSLGFNINELKSISDFENNGSFYLDFNNSHWFIKKDRLKEMWNRDEKQSFDKYLDELKVSIEDYKNEKIIEIQSKREQIKEINTLPAFEFIQKYDISLTDEAASFLSVCFRNGYIDSDYRQLIFGDRNNYLYQSDDEFVRYNNYGVGSGEFFKDNFGAEIKDVPGVVSQIKEDKFGQKAILNNSIIKFMFNNCTEKDRSQARWKNLKKYLLEDDKDIENYFQSFIENENYSDFQCIVKGLNAMPKVLFRAWIRCISSTLPAQRNPYLQYMINNAQEIIETDLKEFYNVLGCYTEWEGVQINESNLKVLIELAKVNQITFKFNNIETIDIESKKLIAVNKIFEVNRDNLLSISKDIFGCSENELLESVLKKADDDSIKEYIIENINQFCESIDDSILEQQEVLSLLRNPAISEENKVEIVKHSEFKIGLSLGDESNFDDLPLIVVQEIVKDDKFISNITTLNKLFEKYGIEVIKTYFSSEMLAKVDINGDMDSYDCLRNEIKKHLYLEENAVDIMKKFGVKDIEIQTQLGENYDSRICVLIENNLVKCSVLNLNSLIKCPCSYTALVAKNISSFKELIKDELLNKDKEIMTYLLCRIDNKEIETIILNDYPDDVDFDYKINLGVTNDTCFGRILQIIKRNTLTNKRILDSVFSREIVDEGIRKEYKDLLRAHYGLFDNQKIIELFVKIDPEFIKLKENNPYFEKITENLREGLDMLQEMHVVKFKKIAQKQKNVSVTKL